MRSVNIAKFKAQLSKFLRIVRNGGEVVLMDRNTPVAKVIPFLEKQPFQLTVREPPEDPAGLAKLTFAPPKGCSADSLSTLLEDRSSR